MTDSNASLADDEGVVIHEHFECWKEELWAMLTDDEELSAWLGGRCSIEGLVVVWKVPKVLTKLSWHVEHGGECMCHE